MIDFECAVCGEELHENQERAGTLSRCPACEFDLIVPESASGINLKQLEDSITRAVFKAHIRLFMLLVLLSISFCFALFAIQLL